MNNKHNFLQTKRTPFGVLFAILITLFTWGSANAQVITNSGSGLAPTYTSLDLAITALNAATITAPVIITLTANETAPIGGYSITAQGTSVNTITIQGSPIGGTITANPALVVGVVTDAIFKLVGADFVTIQGLTMQENIANTVSATAATNNMTEWGVALLYASATNGAQNNTIQNNTISLNRTYPTTFGIYSNVRHTATVGTVTADITAPTGANSNNKVYTNTISNVNYGIVFIGANLAANMDSGNDIGGISTTTGNTLTNWGGGPALTSYISLTGSNAGIFTNHQLGINSSFNTLTSATISGTTASIFGVLNAYTAAQPAGSFALNLTNNTVTISSANLSGAIVGVSSQSITTALVGVTSSLSNNIIQNCVISGVTTSSAFNGVTNSSAVGTLQINNNIIRGITSTATTGGFVGVSNSGAVVTSASISNNQIGTATSPAITFSAATSGGVTCITNTGATNTAAITITLNDIRGIVQTVISSNAHTYINCTGTPLTVTVSNNTFTNITANTTGNVTFVAHSYSMPPNGAQTFNNNSIVTGFSKTGAGGIITGFTSNGSSPNASISTITNNNLSNITATGATSITGIANTDGSGSSPNRVATGNTFNNWTGATGAYTGISFGYIGASSNISNNTISNYNSTGNITGLNINNTFAGGNPLTISNNTITGLVSAGAGGSVVGLINSNSSPIINITGNTITGLSTTASSARGLTTSAGTVVNISKNKIGDISTNFAIGITEGIFIFGGITINVANNLIGDLRASASAISGTTDAVRGITVASGVALSNINVYFNTVNIAGTSSGPNFNSAAIFHATNATATTATLDMRNNIFVNNGVATTTGTCVAYRRSSVALNNFALTSNRNDFFAPIIFADGTNTDATLAAYQTRVGIADANSISTNPTFLSTSVASALFLHINPSSPTTLESAGANIAGITDDFDGDVRQGNPGYAGAGTAPDIGADEFNLVIVACSAAAGGTSATSTPSLCAGSTATLSNTGATTVGTGLSYQWQVSTTTGGPYINVVGGTGATTFNYTSGALTAGTYYYVLRTTCVNGPITNISNQITVTVNPTPTTTVTPTSASYCNPGGTAVVLTAAGGTTYTWSPAAGLSATTGAVVSATPTMTTTYTVTGTTAGCSSTATVTVTVLGGVSIAPATATNATICAGGSSQLNVVAVTNSPILITEVTLFGVGIGATTPYPAFVVGDDLVEISNISSAPINISGYTISDYATNSTINSHPYTFPVGTIIPANSVAVVHLGIGTDDIANRYYNAGGISNTWSSGSLVGVVLRNGTSIVDAVGLGSGFVFEPTLSIGTNWSGFAPSASGFAGVIRTSATDNNTGANWSASATTLLQTIGTYNGGYTAPVAPTYSWSPTTFLNNAAIANPLASAVTSTTTYTVTATVGTCSTTSTVTVTVASIIVTPAASSSTLTVGTAISNINLVSSGGVAPYIYAATSGTLPAGLSLLAGVISGTPTTAQTATPVTITSTDANGCTGTVVYTFAINGVGCPAITFTNTTAPAGVVGTAYSLNAVATVASGTLTYTVTTLPAGLSINTATGLISGTPSAPTASATYTVTATQGACSNTQNYTFAITVPSTCTTATTPTLTLAPVVASAGTLVRGTVEVAYSQQFTGTGVTGTYTYAISFPTALLPDGISFNAATGLLSGTPKFSTSVTFIVTASVGGCPSAGVPYTLVINPAVATAFDNSLASQVKVSPNPSSNDFNVDFGSINMVKSSVRVYDAQGKTVFTADNNSNLITISLDKFAAGIYLLEVETSKGRILKRLAKQ